MTKRAARSAAARGADGRLGEITDLCRNYANAREGLETLTEEIESDRRQAVRRKLRALKNRIAEASAAREALKAALEASPELFAKPRTRAIEGIKIGYRKLPGRFEIADEGRAIRRVRDKMPEREEELIRVKESLDRAALKRLDARELASIGVAVVEADDEIVIAAASTDLDKLIEVLLADDDLAEAA